MKKYLENLDPTQEEKSIFEKLEILKRAMSLPPTTQQDIFEIAKKILESEEIAKKR